MTDEVRELRRRLWELADQWDRQAEASSLRPYATAKNHCARRLREALTYPAATEADEAALVQTYGKTSDELADEAERGYSISGPDKIKPRHYTDEDHQAWADD